MARKNLLSDLTDDKEAEQSVSGASLYPVRGASKSMIRSVNELAKQADAYLQGEQLVELDPDMIDGSFIADRLGDDQEQYLNLLEAIRERGQDTPILVRPHPDFDQRYMIVFGHRRVRVAKELGRKVRAFVKVLNNEAHVIPEGQENSARSNLSFIEKAAFAKQLEDLHYGRDVICSALASNEAAVSKMISVVNRVPPSVLRKIGSAPSVGRERWVEMSLLVHKRPDMVSEVFAVPEFLELDSSERFDRLFAALNAKRKPVKKTMGKPEARSWASPDKSVSVTFKRSGKTAMLALGAANGTSFAEWISDSLDDLYEAFRKSEKTE